MNHQATTSETAASRAGRRSAQAPLEFPPPGPKLAGLPHIVLLGASPMTRRIERACAQVGVMCRQLDSLSELRRQLSDEVRAVFILPPIEGSSAARTARALRKVEAPQPVFMVMAGAPPPREMRRLYESGVDAVFEWPADKHALTRTAFRLAGDHAARPAAAADVALEELVNDHLRSAAVDFGEALYARVQHGFAILHGHVDGLWKLPIAEHIAGQVKGVQEVVTRGVQVRGDNRTGRALTKAVRQLLKHAADARLSQSLEVHVEDGHVRLSGLSDDVQEMDRIVGLLQHLRGVKRVEHVGPGGARKEQDRKISRAVQRALSIHHGEASIEATVFAGIVILSGQVGSAAQRQQVENLVRQQAGVRRVVEKLKVAPSRDRRKR